MVWIILIIVIGVLVILSVVEPLRNIASTYSIRKAMKEAKANYFLIYRDRWQVNWANGHHSVFVSGERNAAKNVCGFITWHQILHITLIDKKAARSYPPELYAEEIKNRLSVLTDNELKAAKEYLGFYNTDLD